MGGDQVGEDILDLGGNNGRTRKPSLEAEGKERREDSDDAGVRGHNESPKNSPNNFLGGGTRGGRRSRGVNQSQSGSRWRNWRRVSGESQRPAVEKMEVREMRELLCWCMMHDIRPKERVVSLMPPESVLRTRPEQRASSLV